MVARKGSGDAEFSARLESEPEGSKLESSRLEGFIGLVLALGWKKG